jgi:hypothetical protein
MASVGSSTLMAQARGMMRVVEAGVMLSRRPRFRSDLPDVPPGTEEVDVIGTRFDTTDVLGFEFGWYPVKLPPGVTVPVPPVGGDIPGPTDPTNTPPPPPPLNASDCIDENGNVDCGCMCNVWQNAHDEAKRADEDLKRLRQALNVRDEHDLGRLPSHQRRLFEEAIDRGVEAELRKLEAARFLDDLCGGMAC